MIGITLRVPLGSGGIHLNKIGEIRGFLDTLNQKALLALGAKQAEPILDIQYVSGKQGILAINIYTVADISKAERLAIRTAIDTANFQLCSLLKTTAKEAIDCKIYTGGQLQQAC